MKEYIVYFGFNCDGEYVSTKSKPILAESDQDAAIKLIDQFESYEGIPCEVYTVEEVKK